VKAAAPKSGSGTTTMSSEGCMGTWVRQGGSSDSTWVSTCEQQ
jgi:hypothetical protein